MIKKKTQIIIFIVACLVVVSFAITFLIMRENNSRKITFIKCEKAGGEAWLVDLSHPDFCPNCDGQPINADVKMTGSLSTSCTNYPSSRKAIKR